MSHAPADGFEPLFRTSPFLDQLGPIYQQRSEKGLILGLRVQEEHCNGRGKLHGGVISAIADVAMGYNLAFSTNPPTPVVTVHLDVDFLDCVDVGDWLEVHSEIDRMGQRTAFAHSHFRSADRLIARASAVFSVSRT